MFILKCSLCGREQMIKKRLDKDTYELLTQNFGLLCGCKNCQSYRGFKVPKGFVRYGFVLGNWSVIRPMDIESYKDIQRAKDILDRGMEKLKEQEKVVR